MDKKTYIIPEVDVCTMEGCQLLAGFSVTPKGATTKNGGELDANTSSFEEEVLPSKGLWDEE